jgi:hypothetical protein
LKRGFEILIPPFSFETELRGGSPKRSHLKLTNPCERLSQGIDTFGKFIEYRSQHPSKFAEFFDVMDAEKLADLHDTLERGKSKRGKFGGIGAGERHSLLLDGPKQLVLDSDKARMPARPLYQRFVMASRKELCRKTVMEVLEQHGGELRWDELVALVAQGCGEVVTREFKYRVLVNIPEKCLSSKSPLVRLSK